MNRFKTLTKPLMALFVVIVFAWLVIVTRYQYGAEPTYRSELLMFFRTDKLTGTIEYQVVSGDSLSGWTELLDAPVYKKSSAP